MLGNKMSNQEEDEVEDELEAIEREVNGPIPAMPHAPSGVMEGELPEAPKETPEERSRRRRQERANRQRGLEPIAA